MAARFPAVGQEMIEYLIGQFVMWSASFAVLVAAPIYIGWLLWQLVKNW